MITRAHLDNVIQDAINTKSWKLKLTTAELLCNYISNEDLCHLILTLEKVPMLKDNNPTILKALDTIAISRMPPELVQQLLDQQPKG